MTKYDILVERAVKRIKNIDDELDYCHEVLKMVHNSTLKKPYDLAIDTIRTISMLEQEYMDLIYNYGNSIEGLEGILDK